MRTPAPPWSTSPVDFVVTLHGGDAHSVTFGRERGARVGWCDCKGYEYRDDDSSPCAHLCLLRKAEFIGATDVNGRPIRPGDTASLAEASARETEPELRADGGRDDLDNYAAGDDGRMFGRPEFQQ